MKKITPAVLALFLCAWGHLVSAQMASFFPGPGTPATSGGGTPFSITAASNTNSNVAGASFSFATQAIGTVDATRIVVVAIVHSINAVTVSSVTIGGVNATQATGAAQVSGGGAVSDIWYLAVPAGTTSTIVVNFSGSQSRCGISVYSVVGTGAAFSTAGGNNVSGAATSLAATVTVPAGGGAIAVLSNHGATAASVSFTNMITDVNGIAFGTSTLSSGHDTSHSGSTTYTANWTNTNDATLSIATFTP